MEISRRYLLRTGVAATGASLAYSPGEATVPTGAFTPEQFGAKGAASRAALVGLATTSPVYLSEAGREGVFVFDSANLEAKVTSDTREGIYVAPSGQTGSTGAWRRRYTGPISVTWFGAIADCTAVGVGTDNTPAFNAARDRCFAEGNSSLFIPRGRYRLTQRWVFTQGITIEGEGWFQNPGIAGGINYPGILSIDGTLLVFDVNTPGMIFYANSDITALAYDTATSAEKYKYKSAFGSHLSKFMLWGGGGTNVIAHGIENRTVVTFDGVRCDYFAGSGFHTDAAGHTENTPYGGADMARYIGCKSRGNLLHGFSTRGNDSNVIMFDTCDSNDNGGAGFLERGQLGNVYINCHQTSSNKSFGLTTTQRTQAVADSERLSTQTNGAFITTSGIGAHAFIGCYTENAPTSPGSLSYLVSPSTVIGGNLASGMSTTGGSIAPDSTAHIYGFGSLDNTNKIRATNAGILTMESSKIDLKPLTGNAILSVNSPGTFGFLEIKGQNLLSNGLEITAGQAATGYSCNTHVFRNAASTVTFGTFDVGGLNLGSGKVLKVNGTQVVGARQVKPATPTLADVIAVLTTHGLWA